MTIHCVSFKTNVNVANAQQMKERDCARVKHHRAGHQPQSHHGKQPQTQPQPCGTSGSATCIPVMNNSKDDTFSSFRLVINGDAKV